MEREKTRTICSLYGESIDYLDGLGIEQRKKFKHKLDRSAMVRSILDAVHKSGINIIDHTTEHELTQMLIHQLTK